MSENILYHYTHRNALINILRNRSLWAADYKYLIDNNEITKLCSKLKDFNPNNIYIQKIADLSSSLPANKGIFSLSEQGDLLSEWIHYGEYAVGFNVNNLNKCLESQGFYPLQRCIYNENAQNKILDNFIADSDSFDIENFLSTIALLFKDSKFSEEKEWRAISSSLPLTSSSKHDKWKIRITSSKHIVEYLEINLSEFFPIEEIIISSEKDFAEEKESLENILLKTYGLKSLDKIHILKSSIPFRKI
ncbi:MAG: DUF2971 domain-containing protein [Clostridium sp.]|nr:DUF2971 domain-containing protein [Clostridium sp.]